MTTHAVLPISQVLSTLSHEYVAALSVYRHDAPPGSDAFHAARAQWIEFFAGSVLTATEQAATIEMELMEAREEWNEAIERHRAATGKKRALRSDSITQLILDDLPSTPILTTSSAIRIHGGTRTAAHNALGDLVEAGILRIRRARGKYLYSAPAVLELIDLSVRRLASTRFDTRVNPPIGPAPARPARARSH